MDAFAFCRRPFRNALDAGIENGKQVFHIVGDEEVLGEFEDPLAGFGVDIDVGDEIFTCVAGPQRPDGGVDLLDFGADGSQVFGRGLERRGGLLGRKEG